MEEGVFPGIQASMDENEIEEERRLAYVAITRAKESLYITTTRSRLQYGRTQYNPPSRFIEEIPPKLMVSEKAAGAEKKASYEITSANKVYYRKPEGVGDTITVTQKVAAARKQPPKEILSPGDRVRHMVFGEGEILSVKPMGGDVLYEVMFEKVGTKKLMGTYAKLTKI